ncbi:MAG: hypothetical protein Q9220_007534 [cf. Caloplaca sp. 1 TL-2023]
MKHLTHIAVQFRLRTAPTGEQCPVPAEGHTKRPPAKASAAKTSLAPSISQLPTSPSPEQLTGPRPDRFPLARISQSFQEDGYIMLLLVFSRNTFKKINSNRHWSWPATAAFLHGLNKWPSTLNKGETVALFRKTLDEHAAIIAAIDTPYALRQATRGYWLVDRSELSTPSPAVGALPQQALVIEGVEEINTQVAKTQVAKRKREELERDIEALEKLQAETEAALKATRQKVRDCPN